MRSDLPSGAKEMGPLMLRLPGKSRKCLKGMSVVVSAVGNKLLALTSSKHGRPTCPLQRSKPHIQATLQPRTNASEFSVSPGVLKSNFGAVGGACHSFC